ncbi:MAG: hypothetical protein KDK40_02050, partial [Chlamydiia bacterium]|nr:hypothetical protein [Chlamydiia bacterium]
KGSKEEGYYLLERAKRTLRQVLPQEILKLLTDSKKNNGENIAKFRRCLPYFTEVIPEAAPCPISIITLSEHRKNSFKYLYDMLSRWLVPGHSMNVFQVHATDLIFGALDDQVYTFCEIVLVVDNQVLMDEIRRNLSVIRSQVIMGLGSAYYARKILEVKGLATDDRIAMLQEQMTYLIERMPNRFNQELFDEMQRFLISSTDSFKAKRTSRHLSRVVSLLYSFRRQLIERLSLNPDRRHIFVKIYKMPSESGNPSQILLGLVIGMSFLHKKEYFDSPHVSKAIEDILPDLSIVPDSFFTLTRDDERIKTFYVECRSNGQRVIPRNEILKLQNELPNIFQGYVERVLPPVFNPRNEEEIMRQIVSLGKEIRYVRDVPQVCITFDEQTHFQLSFIIVIVRVIKEDFNLEEKFIRTISSVQFVPDRTKILCTLRNKYPVQADVFHLLVDKSRFVRNDQSINLYKARQHIGVAISHVIGPYRDFNGGMISRQHEILENLKSHFDQTERFKPLMIETLFYNIMPAIMRNLLEESILVYLVRSIIQSSQNPPAEDIGHELSAQEFEGSLYCVISTDASYTLSAIDKAINSLDLQINHIAKTWMVHHERRYTGYLFYQTPRGAEKQIIETLSEILRSTT